MTTYWNEKIETLPREEITDLQLERLQVTLNRAYTKVDFYRHRFEELGLLPEDITSSEDLKRIPCTTVADLADYYPYWLFSVPLKSFVRLKFS
ncbi:MAG: phenylacetate--CoA ligase, partial [Deltaproteobacteria bacterium]